MNELAYMADPTFYFRHIDIEVYVKDQDITRKRVFPTVIL